MWQRCQSTKHLFVKPSQDGFATFYLDNFESHLEKTSMLAIVAFSRSETHESYFYNL
jgi:hypothetical protein